MTKETLHIYTRVSTRAQERDGASLDEQEKAGKALAKALNLKPVIHNEGGKSSNHEEIDKRPILSSLLYQCSQGEVKHLYSWSFDRLSRQDYAQAIIRKHLRDHAVLLYQGSSTHPTKLSDPKDEMFLVMQSAFASYENSQRVARSRLGKIARTKQGRWHGGPPPYGYEIKNGKLSPQKDEAKTVNRIFDLYIKGKTLKEIREDLFSKNVATRRGKASFSDRTLQLILTENSHYGGFYLVEFEGEKTIRVECPQIVTADKILKAKEVYKQRSRIAGGRQTRAPKAKRTFLLREKLWCGACGARFGATHKPNQRVSVYYCVHSQHRYKMEGKGCSALRNSINLDETDNAVVDAVCDTLSESHLFREQIKREVLGSEDTLKQTQTKMLSTKKKIRQLKEEITKIKDQIINLNLEGLIGLENPTDIKKIYKRLQDYQTQREQELESAKLSLQGLYYSEGWLDWVKRFGDIVSEMKTDAKTLEEKKAFIDGIVDSIVITFTDKQTAQLDIQLLYPYVGDQITYKDQKDKRKGYNLEEGKKSLSITHLIEQRKKGRPKKKTPQSKERNSKAA